MTRIGAGTKRSEGGGGSNQGSGREERDIYVTGSISRVRLCRQEQGRQRIKQENGEGG